MLFLKTKEEIAYELLSYPFDRTDYSSLSQVLAHKTTRISRERIRRARSSFSSAMNENSFRYYCGSGKKFKLSDARVISSFFKAPNPPEFRGEVETHGTWWGVLDDRTTHFNSVYYSGWHFYTFIRSPSPGDGFCNLVCISYRGRTVARSGSYREFQKISYDPIWSLDNARPKIKTLWTCKYETACELIGGDPIKDGYNFMEIVRRLPDDFLSGIRTKKELEYHYKQYKKYRDAIKNKDWRYVLNETLEWLIIIIMLVIGLGVAIFLVIKLGMLFI